MNPKARQTLHPGPGQQTSVKDTTIIRLFSKPPALPVRLEKAMPFVQ